MRSKKSSQKTGLMANIIENHDEPRGVSRYIPEGEVTEISKKMLAGLMMMTYGLPFLYQGQEIGMTNTRFESISDINDISTIEEYRLAREQGFDEREALDIVAKFSRDNARTPMQWSDQPSAGFTCGTPWLKVNPNYTRINAASQIHDENSVFSYYKALISLRKNPLYKDTLVYGQTVPYLESQKNLMAFFRKGEKQSLLILANFQNEPQEVLLPEENYQILINNCPQLEQQEHSLKLQGYQAVVLALGV